MTSSNINNNNNTTTNTNIKKSIFPLAPWAAGKIDQSYLEQPTNVFSQFLLGTKQRLYALGLTGLSVIDMAVFRALSQFYSTASYYTTDETQHKFVEEQKKYANIYSKNFYATLASLTGAGIINPKLIAFYFTPEKLNAKGITAGGNYHHSKKTVVKHPQNTKELQGIVREAIQNGDKIMAVGAGRSQGKQFIPKGESKTVVDLDHFDTIEINKKEKTATVGAGVRWADLQIEANKCKLALQVMQASNVFSVGGSIGTNIHGWDHLIGTLSNSILSMDIINAKGEKQTLTPNDPLFHQVTGGMGLFGIVTSVKLKLTDNELLNEKGTAVPIAEYVEHFRKNVETNPNIRMHLYRLSLDPKNLLSSGIAVDYIKEDGSKRCKAPNLTKEGPQGTRAQRIVINLARRSKAVRKYYWDSECKRLLANDSKPLTRNEIMQPPISAMFNPSVSEAEWLQEYFLSGDQLPSFLNELGKILTDNEVILLNASVRFVKQNPNPALHAYAKEGDRFAVVLCFNQSLRADEVIKAKKWLRESQHVAVNHGGTYYLPYQHVSSPEDFNHAYPQAKEALRMKKESDPQEIFTSGFYQKYLATQPVKPNYFKKLMATPEMQKKFSGFLENVLQRVDTKKFYTLLTDIMTYSDSHAEIYKELCRRISEIKPSPVTAMRQTLGSLSEIKKDLGEQAKVLLSDTKVIDGLVEIGYPGRFIPGFKKDFKVTGQIAAVHEKQSPTDYIEAGIPRPYQKFAKLDYHKPNLATLEDNSADVITCYIGLHHFPNNELETFLKDVRRVLRPGGKFLLVDHDVVDEEAMVMAHMAHSVYNAVYDTSLENELKETRHFHPISYWSELLQKYDLGYQVTGPDISMIRAGDPTRNRMVNFVNHKKLELNNDNRQPDSIVAVEPDSKAQSSPGDDKNVWIKDLKDTNLSEVPVGLLNQTTNKLTNDSEQMSEEKSLSLANK